MDQGETFHYVWTEYLLDSRPSELTTLFNNPRVRTAEAKTRCSVQFTRRVLNKRKKDTGWCRYSIIRITGPDDQSISQCNRLLEQAIPGYNRRKEYPRRAPITFYSRNVEAEGDLRSRLSDIVHAKKRRGISESSAIRLYDEYHSGSRTVAEIRSFSVESDKGVESPVTPANSFVGIGTFGTFVSVRTQSELLRREQSDLGDLTAAQLGVISHVQHDISTAYPQGSRAQTFDVVLKQSSISSLGLDSRTPVYVGSEGRMGGMASSGGRNSINYAIDSLKFSPIGAPDMNAPSGQLMVIGPKPQPQISTAFRIGAQTVDFGLSAADNRQVVSEIDGGMSQVLSHMSDLEKVEDVPGDQGQVPGSLDETQVTGTLMSGYKSDATSDGPSPKLRDDQIVLSQAQSKVEVVAYQSQGQQNLTAMEATSANLSRSLGSDVSPLDDRSAKSLNSRDANGDLDFMKFGTSDRIQPPSYSLVDPTQEELLNHKTDGGQVLTGEPSSVPQPDTSMIPNVSSPLGSKTISVAGGQSVLYTASIHSSSKSAIQLQEKVGEGHTSLDVSLNIGISQGISEPVDMKAAEKQLAIEAILSTHVKSESIKHSDTQRREEASSTGLSPITDSVHLKDSPKASLHVSAASTDAAIKQVGEHTELAEVDAKVNDLVEIDLISPGIDRVHDVCTLDPDVSISVEFHSSLQIQLPAADAAANQIEEHAPPKPDTESKDPLQTDPLIDHVEDKCVLEPDTSFSIEVHTAVEFYIPDADAPSAEHWSVRADPAKALWTKELTFDAGNKHTHATLGNIDISIGFEILPPKTDLLTFEPNEEHGLPGINSDIRETATPLADVHSRMPASGSSKPISDAEYAKINESTRPSAMHTLSAVTTVPSIHDVSKSPEPNPSGRITPSMFTTVSDSRLLVTQQHSYVQNDDTHLSETHTAVQLKIRSEEISAANSIHDLIVHYVQGDTKTGAEPTQDVPGASVSPPLTVHVPASSTHQTMERDDTIARPHSPGSMATSISTNLEVYVNRGTGRIDLSFDLTGSPVAAIQSDVSLSIGQGYSISAEWNIKLEHNVSFGPVGFISTPSESPTAFSTGR